MLVLSPLVLTGLAPFLGRPGQSGYFYATPTGERLATTDDLACNRPHTRRICSEIGFRAWNPPALKPRPLPPGHRGLPKLVGSK
ncbi:hypothetical protein AVEN_179082-1 [Araneus ventricosus]|uniref:Uncharacterized protein n=1 Tax=Araneus ventricosus TaxID=182803 RepID=A0A4Y2VBZ1_ARAVE|nr:hypothetical protein AVEN_5352-1 [Araneus ventricosus]GBO22793.1 hypothetical protein AVEN_146349-1 [Araneus ventricosus]GBO25887.1 hypothetical protein AVEN_12913-1 [Araneus ventricosus]GBO25888.1 hypothetical protein AVEN_179082-1 [Araneus ventricosus]